MAGHQQPERAALEPVPETTLTSLGLSSIITVRRSEGHPTDGLFSFESLSKQVPAITSFQAVTCDPKADGTIVVGGKFVDPSEIAAGN